MTGDRVVPACVFCGSTIDEVTLTSRSGSSAHACYDCVTLLACTAASDPAPRASSRACTNEPGGLRRVPPRTGFLGRAERKHPGADRTAEPVVEVKCSFCGKPKQKARKLILDRASSSVTSASS